MALEISLGVTEVPLLPDVLRDVAFKLETRLATPPVLQFEDQPFTSIIDRGPPWGGGLNGGVSVPEDDASVYVDDYMDDDGGIWLTVEATRTTPSLILMAAVVLALMQLAETTTAEDPWDTLGLGHVFTREQLTDWVDRYVRGASLTEAAENWLQQTGTT